MKVTLEIHRPESSRYLRKIDRTIPSKEFQEPLMNNPATESNLPVYSIQSPAPTKRMTMSHKSRFVFFIGGNSLLSPAGKVGRMISLSKETLRRPCPEGVARHLRQHAVQVSI